VGEKKFVDSSGSLKQTSRRYIKFEKECGPTEEGKWGGGGKGYVYQNEKSTKTNRHRKIVFMQNDKRYNETMGEIARLKKAIDLLRQEKTMYQNNLKSLEGDI